MNASPGLGVLSAVASRLRGRPGVRTTLLLVEARRADSSAVCEGPGTGVDAGSLVSADAKPGLLRNFAGIIRGAKTH